jgi:nucleoside-diphosphate-sugar epimerase
MNNILVTGASGFVGSILIPKLIAKGKRVYALSRHPPAAGVGLIPLKGDITESNLGLANAPDIDAVYHLAAIHTLGPDKKGLIEKTNIQGTRNVIDFCTRHDIPQLFFCSTAYTSGGNPYEMSKIVNERQIDIFASSNGIRATIFKPSIIMGTTEHPFPGHFSQFVYALVRFLRIAGIVKSRIEGTLGLPVLEMVHHVQGNPEGKLNLVTVEVVARAMAEIDEVGTYWLTNPNPPTLAELAEWVSEYLAIDFRIVQKFDPTPLEARFMKVTRAFTPYLEGDSFHSDIKDCPPITREFIQETIRSMFL